jgi:hypothetical protein
MNYIQFLEDLDNDVTKSDFIHAQDDVMYSNADVVSYYSNGIGFDLTDNTELYEIVKLFRDIVDKHLYSNNFKYNITVKNRELKLFFEYDKEDKHAFFLERLIDIFVTKVSIIFKNQYTFKNETRDSDNDTTKTVVIVTASKKDNK